MHLPGSANAVVDASDDAPEYISPLSIMHRKLMQGRISCEEYQAMAATHSAGVAQTQL